MAHIALIFSSSQNILTVLLGVLTGGKVMNIPHLGTSQRVKMISIEPILLARMLTKAPDSVKTEIVEGIPQTAGVVGGAFDHARGCFVLFVADNSFDEVQPGQYPPELPITVKAHYDDEPGNQTA